VVPLPHQGCLEAYAGGWAIAERAQEATRTKPEPGQRLIALAGSTKQISAATVSQVYIAGDSLADYLVKETVQHLAAGMVGIVNAFNPYLLVLGGGVIEGLPEYIPMIEHIVQTNALQAAAKYLRIVKSTLGSKAGATGAASLVQNRLKSA
jgi:glucokinase